MESSSLRRQLHRHPRTSATNRSKSTSKSLTRAILGKRCPICVGHIDDRRAAVITTCVHAYCIDCIPKWSDLKRKCPLCNARFDSLFFKNNRSSRTFDGQLLSDLDEDKKVNQRSVRRTKRSINRSQWRASIYEQGLRSVPSSSRNYLEQNLAGKCGFRERILQK